MSLAFDENGRPFIILREQEKKKRVKGLEAHKVGTFFCLKQVKPCTKNNGRFQKKSTIVALLECCLTLAVDQHHGSTHCGKSLEDFPWTQRHGQNARESRW